MPYERIYVDLDRTLLDTPRFSEAVIAAVEQEFDIPAKDFEAGMPDFYVHHGAMRYYDFFAHITMIGLDAQDVEAHLRTVLAGGDFIYPDAHHLLKTLANVPIETIVLSYGPASYQDFKMSFLPDAQHLPFIATLQLKEDYLAAQESKPCLLVDDKRVKPLPAWCTQFLIDRTAPAASAKEGERLWRINSLQAVETAVGVGYNEHNQKETR